MHAPQMTGLLVTTLLAAALSAPANGGGEITVADDLGRTVRLAAPARRIISLAPSITECLFAVGAGDLVAGVTEYCKYPPEAATRPKIGGVTTPSIEAIVRLHPDLIVLSMEGNARQDFDRLTTLDIPVFVTNPRTLEGIHRSILQLGQLTGHQRDADSLSRTMYAREAAVRERVGISRTPVLLFLSVDPLIAAGSNTFLDDLLRLAGGHNVAASIPGTYPAISREVVLARNPGVLILTNDLVPDTDRLLERFPEWRALDAVRNRRVYRVDPDIVSRPGPRAIDALELLSHYLHPEHP